jgi:1-acyl-sn-glycerol-3-phosphate acyltransferase
MHRPSSFERVMAFDRSVGGAVARGALRRWFRADIVGAEVLPSHGAALLVGNHAMLGLDGVVLGALVREATGRYVRFLGDRNLWRIPVVSDVLTAFGAQPGEQQSAQQLLAQGELVGVYPGGAVDSFKLTPRERYRLQWGQRAGFARLAMRAGVPIVPVAGLGIDEMYTVWAREPVLGRRLFGSSRYDLPLAFGAWGTPLPRRVPLRFEVLCPIDTSGDPDDPEAVSRVREATRVALASRLDRYRTTGR